MVDISQLLGTTIMEFIDYSLMLVVVMILYYGFRMFVVGGSGDNAAGVNPWERRQNWTREQVGRGRERAQQQAQERQTQRDTRRGQSERRRWLGRGRGILARMIGNFNDINNALTVQAPASINTVRSRLTTITRDVRAVMDLIVAAQNRLEGNQRTALGNWYNYAEAIHNGVVGELSDDNNIPDPAVAAHWVVTNAAPHSVLVNYRNLIINYRARCGVLMNAIEEFVNNDNIPAVP